VSERTHIDNSVLGMPAQGQIADAAPCQVPCRGLESCPSDVVTDMVIDHGEGLA